MTLEDLQGAGLAWARGWQAQGSGLQEPEPPTARESWFGSEDPQVYHCPHVPIYLLPQQSSHWATAEGWGGGG